MATVLVVDDVADNREIACTLLGYRGHEVIEASEGAQALTLTHTHHPDVVVTDVLMPGMDGYDLVRELRADPDPDTAGTPVIFYTSNYLEPETRPIAEACGVSEVILRSADPRLLLDAVDAALAHGPVHVEPISADAFARNHHRAINTALLEKVRELHDTEQRFHTMAESSPVGIALIDPAGHATYVNPRLCEIMQLPVEDLLHQGWLACLEPDLCTEALDTARGQARSGVEHRYRSRITRHDNTPRWLRIHLRAIHDEQARPTGAIAMIDDVSDVVEADERAQLQSRRRQLEAKLRVTERLESLGRMAGGVAHDFNNILGAMLGFLDLTVESITEQISAGRLDADDGAQILEDLGRTIHGGKRAAGLTQQLLAFGRRDVIQPVAVNLNTLIHETIRTATEAAGEHIETHLNLADNLPRVSADPGQLKQALHNLIANARDATPDGGTLTLETASITFTDDTPGHLPPGDYVRMTVTDTGHGMPADILERAVEPFFTTKPGGQTAGLGLATVHGITNQAGGDLVITSTPGVGTSVHTYLPATYQSELPDQPDLPDPTSGSRGGGGGGGETILVVDDEEDLREVVTRILTSAGYHILTAPDGPRALAIAEQHLDRIHCLLTDVAMPGMPGRELAERLTAQRPDTAVLYMSGFAAAIMDEQGILEPGVTVLTKPFSVPGLLTALRNTLDKAPQA
jgi:PAS domain S-box-containing protein